MSDIHDLGPVYITVDGPYITDEDRARAMWITIDTGRQVHMTVRKRPWWKFWGRKSPGKAHGFEEL